MDDGECSHRRYFRKIKESLKVKPDESTENDTARQHVRLGEGSNISVDKVQKPSASETSSSSPLGAIKGRGNGSDTKASSSGTAHLLEVTESVDSLRQAKPFHLEPFKMLHVSPGTGLENAEKQLHKAFEELEIVLREKRSSEKYALNMAEVLQTGDGESIYSLSKIITELQQHHKNQEATKSIRVDKLVAAAMPTLRLILNVTGTMASSVSGLGPSHIGTNGLTQIFDIVMAPNVQVNEVLSGLDLSLMDQRLIKHLEVLPRHEINHDILRRALNLQTALFNFLRISLQWLRYKYVSKVGRVAIGMDKVQVARSSLQAARDALRICISDDMYLKYKRNMLEQRTAEELDQVCSRAENLRHLAKQRQQLHVQRLPGTAESIIQDPSYPNWGSQGPTTLWCTGLAGAGKTFSASAVIDQLELFVRDKRNIGLAYFFCSFAQREGQDVQSLIGALTRQLIARMQSTADLQVHGELPTLEDRKLLFKTTVAQFEAVYIVIDAFDEFSTDHNKRLALADTLADLSEGSRCYFCVTSREADDVFSSLPNAVKVPIRASESEIRQYVEYRIQSDKDNTRAKRLARQDRSLVKDLSESILKKSGRIFKLAELQLTEALRGGSPQAVRDRLATLTSDIDGYYKKTMERIYESDMKPEILKLLTWVITCKTPINVGQMTVALGTMPERIDENFSDTERWLAADIHYYISACEGLLRVQHASDRRVRRIPGSNLITLAHETVDTFFRINKESLLPAPNCLILKHSFEFLKGQDPTLMQLSPPPRKLDYSHEVWDILEYILALTQPEYESLHRWAFDNSGFPHEGRLGNAIPLAMFTAIAEHWADYAQEAISEDSTSVTTIKEFLAAYNQRQYDSNCGSRWNSMHYCAARNWCVLLQLLIDDGIDVNTPIMRDPGNDFGPSTPLMVALAFESYDVFQLLLKDKRVDINLSDHRGFTPLMQVTQCFAKEFSIAATRTLLSRRDVRLNDKDNDGFTALHNALLVRNKDLVDTLLHDPRMSLEDNDFDKGTDEATVWDFRGRKIFDAIDKKKPGQTLNDVATIHGMDAIAESTALEAES